MDYYLLQALPKEIADNWPALKRAIQLAQPDFIAQNQQSLNRILTELLEGRMQCWILSKQTEATKPLAVCITAITDDAILMTKSLYVFSLYGLSNINITAYNTMYDTLVSFGKGQGCTRLTFYTSSRSIITKAREAGFEVINTFLAKEI